MSAFFVSDLCMARVVHAITCGQWPLQEPLQSIRTQAVASAPDPRAAIAKALWEMNNEALRQRYGKYAVEDIPADLLAINDTDEAQLLKSVDCLLYQCFEGNVDETPLYKALYALKTAMEAKISRETPAYELAAWG